MARLPARHQHTTTNQARYEFGAAIGFGIKAPLEQYNNWVSDGAVLLTTASWLIPLLCVTIGFLTT